jgi:hypothetical protein
MRDQLDVAARGAGAAVDDRNSVLDQGLVPPKKRIQQLMTDHRQWEEQEEEEEVRFQTLLWEFLTHFWLLLDSFSVESGRMKAVAAVRRKGANNVEVSLSSIPGSTTVRMAPLATATSLSTFMARAQMAANKMYNI